MKLHKYCALLPRMMADEYQTLKADIKAHGLLEPIVTYEDSILDGRHRYNICEELAVQPAYVQFESLSYSGSPLDFVISKHQRRNLTPDQKAVLADKIANIKNGLHMLLTNEKQLSLSEALIATGASKGQVGKLRKIKKNNPRVIEQIESGETSINIEYQRTLTKQRHVVTIAKQNVLKQRSQDGYAGTLPEQEQQRFNAGIELRQENEAIQTECKNKNTLRSALVQIASSIETLKDAVTVFGIKETLIILSSADDIYGMSNPLLLLACIRNDVDDFLSSSSAINNDKNPDSLQEIVLQ
jgi:ParB-like nuclease domain